MVARQTDDNQAVIVEALRAIGATVHDLSRVGHGCGDILVGWRGANYVLEIKSPTGRLRPIQARWHHAWRGQCAVVRSVEEAYRVIGAHVT